MTATSVGGSSAAGSPAEAAARDAPVRLRESIAGMSGYVPDWGQADRSRFLRLDRNECLWSPAPEVARALTEAVAAGHAVTAYPDSGRLAGPLAEYCGAGVGPDNILVTNGSDQAIDICLRGFLTAGEEMVVARPEFPVYGHVAQVVGARVHGVPYGADLAFPYEDFRAALRRRDPQLIVFVNPNNPTGTAVDTDFVRGVASAHPRTPVIVDEAYFEFTGVSMLPWLRAHPNLVVLRTFSKAFAMAGLRLGYLVAHPSVVEYLRKLRNEFDVNSLAVVAAEAQLGALDRMRTDIAQMMNSVKPQVVDFLRQHGAQVWPGAANFMLVRPGGVEQAVRRLYESGILVRPMRAPMLSQMFRMTLGTADDMAHFMEIYRTRIAEAAQPQPHSRSES